MGDRARWGVAHPHFSGKTMSLKAQLNTIREIKAAGFKVVNSKSIPTDDGACWEATLAFGTQKLVRAFDGGYGGEMEVDLLATLKLSSESIRSRLTAFVALPATQAMLKESLIEGEGYSLEFKTITQAEFDANKAKILAEDVMLTNANLELAMQALADSYETVAKIKRALKTYICFVQHGDDEKGDWRRVKAADTPANREFIRKRDNVDYFLADLVAGL